MKVINAKRVLNTLLLFTIFLGSVTCVIDQLCNTIRTVKENIPNFLNCCEQHTDPQSEAFGFIAQQCTNTKSYKDAYKMACLDHNDQNKILLCARYHIQQSPLLKGKMVSVFYKITRCYSKWAKV